MCNRHSVTGFVISNPVNDSSRITPIALFMKFNAELHHQKCCTSSAKKKQLLEAKTKIESSLRGGIRDFDVSRNYYPE